MPGRDLAGVQQETFKHISVDVEKALEVFFIAVQDGLSKDGYP